MDDWHEWKQAFGAEKIKIGTGRQATVYLWNGFAYKSFCDGYPQSWIDLEIRIQNEIEKTNLPVVSYHAGIPGTIKMDYIAGETLADRMQRDNNISKCLADFVELQRQIHQCDSLRLPKLRDTAKAEIDQRPCTREQREKALSYLFEIDDAPTLCHLDFHPLNVMCAGDDYYIIDWVNARLANPVFDFARTYVIFFETDEPLAEAYRALLKQKELIKEDIFRKAVYVMALLRSKEGINSERVFSLLA